MYNRLYRTLFIFALVTTASSSFSQSGVSCYQCWMDHQTQCFECLSGFPGGGFGCSLTGCTSCDATPRGCGDDGWWGGCFLGDVAIATPDGLLPIKDLKLGDVVLSRSISGLLVQGTIVDTHLVESWSYLEINGKLKVTESHPFYTAGEWVNAGDLSVGDELATLNGETFIITSIEHMYRGVRVYNISVDGHQTFFAEGVCVHNKPPSPGS